MIELPVIEDHERFRAEIASLTPDGKRKWVYAQRPSGRLYHWRKLVSVLLLAFLFLAPVVKVNGNQFMLLDIMERQFVFFGVPFWPNDFYLVALLFLLTVVSIVVFTAVLGRIWCGWLCPQTVFLEMVFRKLEWLIEGSAKKQALRNAGPWNFDRTSRFVLKQGLFFTISFVIANTFLAYFVSTDRLFDYVVQGPIPHIELFVSLVVFTVVFYLVFSRFREQACLIVCPYGRYMSALVDENTIGVMYDHKRGEPRSKWKKHDERSAHEEGHCIDCFQCVAVCPTGVDIRNGNQLECVQCTACIDACNDVMHKVGLPQGLVRYTSAAAIEKGEKRWLTNRIKAYLAIWAVLTGLVVLLFVFRNTLDITLLRSPGTTWTVTSDGIANFYDIQIINKGVKDLPVSFELVQPAGAKLTPLGLEPVARSGEIFKGRFLVTVPEAERTSNEVDIVLNIRSKGETVRQLTTKLLAP